MNWWLFPEQDEFKKSFPYFGVGIVYAIVVVICVAIRAVTWPDNKHVDLSFLV